MAATVRMLRLCWLRSALIDERSKIRISLRACREFPQMIPYPYNQDPTIQGTIRVSLRGGRGVQGLGPYGIRISLKACAKGALMISIGVP